MRHTYKLILCGLIPVIAGEILDKMINFIPGMTGLLLPFISCILLALWGYTAYRVSSPKEGVFSQAVKLNLIGFILLVIFVLMHSHLGSYPTMISIIPQLYYLPCLSITSGLCNWLLALFMPVLSLPLVFCAEYVLMFFSSMIGIIRA